MSQEKTSFGGKSSLTQKTRVYKSLFHFRLLARFHAMASGDVLSMSRFMDISAQLSATEMDAFMTRLWRTAGRDRILQFLCTSLPSFAANQKHVDLLPTASGVVSSIIAERESDEEHSDAIPIKLPDLPSCLVGEIASNLWFYDYIAFSMTNRKIFVDCNSPNRLQELLLAQSDDYSALRLHHFPQTKYLGFQLSRITELNQINGQIFSGNNQIQRIDVALDDVKDSDIDIFFIDQSPCFSSIQTLDLHVSETNDGFSAVRFLKFLSKFPELKEFHLYRMDMDFMEEEMNPDDFRSLYPMISELHLNYFYPMSPLLASWGSKITTLTIKPMGSDEYHEDLSQCELPLLKRLRFAERDLSRSLTYLNMASNASEISFIPYDKSEPKMSDQEVRFAVNLCIARPHLEFLYVSTAGYLRSICDAIKCGLNETKGIEREWMEIALEVDIQTISNAEQFVKSVLYVTEAFIGSKLVEWMFIIEFKRVKNADSDDKGGQDTTRHNAVLDALRESSILQASVELQCSTTKEIVIVSKDCVKERHEKWW